MRTSPFVIMCLTGLCAIFSTTISKSPVLPLFASYLGAGPSGIGFIAAISAFTGVVLSIPAGIIADRVGKKRMLVVSAVVFSSAPFLYFFVSNIGQLAVIRLYHGIATSIFVPVAMAMVSGLYHKERGEKLGWFSTSTLLGRFMAPMAGGGIIGFFAYNPGISFKMVYAASAAAGVAALFLALKIPVEAVPGPERRSWRDTFAIFRGIISSRGILMTSGVEAAILFAYGTFETFLPVYSLQIGLHAYEVGIFLSSQVITLALTKPVMGRFSDRHGRRPQIIAGALTGAACIGGFSMAGSFLTLLILSVLFGLSLSIVTSATSALIADLSREEGRSSAMGVLGSIMDIGHTTGPLSAGLVASYFGIGKSFATAAIVLILFASAFALAEGFRGKQVSEGM